MNKVTKTIKLALLGISFAAFAMLNSCCGSSPEPIQEDIVVVPAK